MTSFHAAIAAHEAWMRGLIPLVEEDLCKKHKRMRECPFAFLRATCFRYAETLPALVPDLLAVTRVPAVGDAHLENFGTWRDAEGRLIWGVNDLDEAVRLPWTSDLLRLAASALLTEAPPRAREVEEALLDGYAERLDAPHPFVLDAKHGRLRQAANLTLKQRARFWKELREAPAAPQPIPDAVRKALLASLPEGAEEVVIQPRHAGLGSLGRPRFVALAQWRGGKVAREAKRRLPSVFLYARMPGAAPLDMAALATAADRVPDPWFKVTRSLVLRRLAPDSNKIEVGGPVALTKLVRFMGGEIANLHAAGRNAAVRRELATLPAGWLRDGARRIADAVRQDYAAWH